MPIPPLRLASQVGGYSTIVVLHSPASTGFEPARQIHDNPFSRAAFTFRHDSWLLTLESRVGFEPTNTWVAATPLTVGVPRRYLNALSIR